MKFIIENNVVTISNKSSVPKIQYYEWEGDYLYSIIQREIIRRSAERPPGDNCPILYAMKNSDDLTTTEDTIDKLYSYVFSSIINYFGNKCNFDLIIPMPSSCSIPLDISQILQNIYNIDILNIADYIVKKEPEEIISLISSNKDVPDKIKQIIVTALNRNKEKLNIKSVKVQYRHYLFPIFKISGDTSIFESYSPTHILLIDDIFASGITLSSVRGILKELYPNTRISALTLFSPLPKIKNKS
ncbi:hypothetical protein QV06_00740 [Gallibacterium genomosp. 3]|uniref:Phosphoribosyltransferase domain-containing protein n=1 Tax=Gallibacterium genomosp. 3 TaxID=505345 RepID=A0A1A7PTQ5_9PAST|nr:hypothetical protein [Gallibacterium genomosp. 3]OBX05958.1 hypothetical protein QV06_00740 [Gallibacterium genomosp. 3]